MSPHIGRCLRFLYDALVALGQCWCHVPPPPPVLTGPPPGHPERLCPPGTESEAERMLFRRLRSQTDGTAQPDNAI
ncbi:DUF6059 family protein [Streptomyces sp. NPDC047841]|uniref:DUF6059 family protein n=1 Tax=Streptomyces sp. NPDC047841 TaxID=3154708 RepID=UPI003453A91F